MLYYESAFYIKIKKDKSTKVLIQQLYIETEFFTLDHFFNRSLQEIHELPLMTQLKK